MNIGFKVEDLYLNFLVRNMNIGLLVGIKFQIPFYSIIFDRWY